MGCKKEEVHPKADLYLAEAIHYVFNESEINLSDIEIDDISVLLFHTDRMRHDQIEQSTQFFFWILFNKDGRAYSVTLQAKEIVYGELTTFDVERLYEGKIAYNNAYERIYAYNEESLNDLGIMSFDRDQMRLSDRDIKHYYELALEIEVDT